MDKGLYPIAGVDSDPMWGIPLEQKFAVGMPD